MAGTSAGEPGSPGSAGGLTSGAGGTMGVSCGSRGSFFVLLAMIIFLMVNKTLRLISDVTAVTLLRDLQPENALPGITFPTDRRHFLHPAG